MNGNKTSKKVSTLAATVAVATAFCGLAATVATTVRAENAPAPVKASATSDYKVILNPGWNFVGGVKKLNTIVDAGVDAADPATYYAENAFVANYDVGETLPTPTSERSDLTFLGWRYAKDGELFTVTTMPAATDGNLYLYADWSAPNKTGGNEDDDPIPTPASVTVNGKAMTKNAKPMAGVDEEYMLKGAKLSAGALEFKVDGSAVTVSTLDGASVGLTFASGKVSVEKDGTFDIYLKKKSGKWEVYGARDVSQDETSIKGEAAVAGNIYLAGNVTDADFSWNNWNASGHKGLKATKNGNTYTLTVKLGKGDDCKFVKYAATDSAMKWQKSLTGGGTNITMADENANMIVATAGTYTFTITEESDRLSVAVTKA